MNCQHTDIALDEQDIFREGDETHWGDIPKHISRFGTCRKCGERVRVEYMYHRMVESDTSDYEFQVGDRVVHDGEGIEGTVVNTERPPAPHFIVEWDDGQRTNESMHTVSEVDNESED